MTDRLEVDTATLRNTARLHEDVAARLDAVAGSAPRAALVGTTHGPIASAVSGALARAVGTRLEVVQDAASVDRELATGLSRVALAYDDRDQSGATDLSDAVDGIPEAETAGAQCASPGSAAAGELGGGTGGSTVPATATTGANGPAPTDSGGESAGQMAGQMGQMAGQLIAQPLMGLAQGLAQLPGQIMQGISSIEQAGESGGTEDDDTEEEEAKDAEQDLAEKSPGAETSETPTGSGTETAGRAPVETGPPSADPAPAPVARPTPAQTRPQ